MQPSALRALEFDRIVEAVTDFALTPMGAERLARLRRRPIRSRSPQLRGGDDRDRRGSSPPTALFPLRASSDLPQILAALAVEGRALEAAAAAGARDLSRLDRRDARRRSAARPDRFPLLEAASARRRVVQGRVGAGARQDRPVGRGRRPREPGAAGDSRSAAQAADAAAQHARVVPARQGDGEVPAGSGRHRAQRPLRARREGRAPQRHSRHRARRVDERREPVSRAAQHRRDQQRHRRARGAGSRGSPAHPAGADRRVPPPRAATCSGRSRPRPSSTCCRRARASPSRSTASSRRSRPTARSSCRRRGIRC